MTVIQQLPLVLVADDEIHTTVMLQRLFEREGFRVETVNNGTAALDAARRLMPNLILMDVQMPGMDGFEVLRNLRDDVLTASIPTILITAKAREPADVDRGLQLGADDYLRKPFNPWELLARARSKMRARQLEDTLQQRTKELEALLRVGEALNQTLKTRDLLDLMLHLMLDLLSGDIAAIYQVKDGVELAVERQTGNLVPLKLSKFTYPRGFLLDEVYIWPGAPSLVTDYTNGMSVLLQHGEHNLGAILIAGNEPYTEDHQRLFKGISRQAALALRNADLYEFQINYATDLEVMVEARTSELRSTQQMLIRSEKLASIGHLAASIAHEINNPLQPIRINLEHMLEDIENDYPIDVEAVKSTQESVERIRRIVAQLLEFAGKRNKDSGLQELDISKTIEGIISLNRKYFEQEGIVIESELPSVPLIFGSKDQLEQVFMNLALNAKAAMKHGDKLRITARLEDQHIRVEFVDTGVGIPSEFLDKIFDPFFSTKENGTGLGLSVSYGIVQSHHGSIEVQSQIGVGTIFTIRLPTIITTQS